MTQVSTPPNAIKFADLTNEQKLNIQDYFFVGENNLEYSSVKVGVSHVTDIQTLEDGYTYIIKNDDIIEKGDSIVDIDANSFDVVFKGVDYVVPYWYAFVKINGTNAIVSRYHYFNEIKGSFLSKFGSLGGADGQFEIPFGIAKNSTHLFITDLFPNNRVQKFDLEGNFVLKFGSSGTGNGEFNNPRGIKVNESNIFVVDAINYRVQIFDLLGVYVSQFGSNGSGNGQFNQATGIAINDTNIFVADTGNDRVQIFDLVGTYVSQFGSTGSGVGEFVSPRGIAVNDTNIFVCNDNGRVQVFDLVGNYVFGFNSDSDGVHDIFVSTDNIFIVDQFNDRIQAYDLKGRFAYNFGVTGVGDGQIASPLGFLLHNNAGVVVDSGNSRIQKFI